MLGEYAECREHTHEWRSWRSMGHGPMAVSACGGSCERGKYMTLWEHSGGNSYFYLGLIRDFTEVMTFEREVKGEWPGDLEKERLGSKDGDE